MIFTGTEPGSSTCRTVISLAARNCYSGFSHIAVQAGDRTVPDPSGTHITQCDFKSHIALHYHGQIYRGHLIVLTLVTYFIT